MAFCPQCGTQAAVGARFCSRCGAALTAAAAAPVAPVTPVTTGTAASGASVMLVSLGTCSALDAVTLLVSACGYSEEEARLMVVSTPITVAQHLTSQQANVLAQALTEYGMEVTVYDHTGYVNMPTSTTSVYANDGNYLAEAAAILGLIGVSNRISRNMMRRWDYPYGRPVVYRAPVPPRRRPAPPRRPVPPPPPAYYGGPAPRPAPARPAPARPAPRPAAPRPAGPRPGPGPHAGPGGRGPRGGMGGPFGR